MAALLLVLVTLTAACTREDDFAAPPDNGTATAAPLTITVSDGAYTSAAALSAPTDGNAPDTRTVERGYGTEFTAGDRIGLYVVQQEANSDRSFLHENLCLTHDGTGWTLPDGTELTYRPPTGGEILYFAYYPYQDNMEEGKVDIDAKNAEGTATTEARWFFDNLINDWQPAADQSTYEAYTAGDLMVSRGTVAKRTDGVDGSLLSFTMEHQMALAVIRVPITKNTYSETIGYQTSEKSYCLYCGLTIKGWMANDNTYRYLAHPNNGNTILGSYYNSSLEKQNFNGTSKLDSPGKYVLFTIDGGAVTDAQRPLKEGDFYMRDGGVIPQEMIHGNMPDGVRADCLGVVLWVGEKKDKYGQTWHWTQTDWRKGDHLLMGEHPGCTHGIVVALKDAANEKKQWSSSSKESTYTWLQNYAATGQETEKELILIRSHYSYGYSPSRCLQWFRDYGNNPTEAYDAIEAFAKANPTPAGCSGWYFPGEYETTVMALGTLNENQNMTATLNTQFGKAGGDKFKTDGFYWSSTDLSAVPEESYCINFSNNERSRNAKNNEGYVRAVLAF